MVDQRSHARRLVVLLLEPRLKRQSSSKLSPVAYTSRQSDLLGLLRSAVIRQGASHPVGTTVIQVSSDKSGLRQVDHWSGEVAISSHDSDVIHEQLRRRYRPKAL